ncbi:peptidase [Nocardia sp. NPDC058176]|uniref:peptidase n=1 Tax=Nocardia sp. NPDC058176 TaxID=3346368 RepID=UPI0036DEBA04
MYRKMMLAATALLVCAACGGDSDDPPDYATLDPPPAPVIPAQPPEFWSQVPQNEAQRHEVAQATRQVDVCALLPRDVLDDLDHVHSVTVGLDSCRAILDTDQPGQGTTLTWHSTLLDSLGSTGRGTTRQFGDVAVRLVPDRDAGEPRSCGATARFPSGAAFYLGLSTPPGQNPCEVADGLMPGMLDRWRESPPQGTSPDTAPTVLLGADPCAVRAKLADTTETGEQQRLTTCLFRYRGERVTVSYEYRVPDYLAERGTEERIDDHPVYRSVSIYDNRIPIFTSAVGPELPDSATQFGTRVPVVEVVSVTDDVGRDVMGQVLTLFPQN